MPSEKLLRHQRLRRKEDFHRCYRRGRRIPGRFLAVHVAPNQQEGSRVGVTVTRKVGNAVQRNRLKRRTREIYRQWPLRQQLPNVDLVVHFYPHAHKAGFNEIRTDLQKTFIRLIEQ